MTKKQRQEVFNKYGGKCAYTGKELGNDWQVDHMETKFRCRMFGKDANSPENLVPALRIVNHYKRRKSLEEWREYMKTFHTRLAKLPKKNRVEKRSKTKAYMLAVAEAFGITADKPFNGVFYFETITNNP